VSREQPELLVQLVFRDFKESVDHRVCRDYRVFRDPKVYREIKVLRGVLARREIRVYRVCRDCKAVKDFKEFRVQRVFPDQLALLVMMGDVDYKEEQDHKAHRVFKV
jgi:hypothetical protein